MTQSMDVAFIHSDPPPPVLRMRLVSRALEILFLVLAIGVGLIFAAMIADLIVPYAGDTFTIGPRGGLVRITVPWGHINPNPHHGLPLGYTSPAAMPVIQRLAHVPVGLLHAVPMVALYWSLHRLFALYARGVVFAPQNARILKHIGVALVVVALAPGLGLAFLTSLHLAIDHNWMRGSSVQELVLGAIVYVIAQVMQMGREIEEERSQFV